jgi:hypothetical protein
MATLVLQSKGSNGGDTHIFSDGPNENRGLVAVLDVGRIGANIFKGLIRFDLSSLPAGAVVTAATLGLKLAGQDFAVGRNIAVHRGLTTWYEGNVSTGSPTSNGSTWAKRNHIGSVNWSSSTAGGLAGTDYTVAAEGGVLTISTVGTVYNYNVTSIVQLWVNDGVTNNGFWVMAGTPAETDSRKAFVSFDGGTAADRPKLTITYTAPQIAGSAAGVATVTGVLKGRAGLEGTAAGSSSFFAQVLQPGAIAGSAAGSSTAEGTLRATGRLTGSAAGVATVQAVGNLIAIGNLASGSAHGVATVTGHLIAYQSMQGSAAGQATATATITMVGFLRGSAAGVATVSGNAWANAVGKAIPTICENTPLLYITDGSYLPNGQLDMLDLLSTRSGFLLKEWIPAIAQYKGGGYFSESVTIGGRRLSRRTFDNAIEVMSLILKSDDQNRAIWFTREYLRWQELAADYWTSDWATRPVYLVGRAPRETQIRYAIIHVMSIPSLANPYSQPFFSRDGKPTMENLALRIERDPWTDVPPGEFEPVPLSSIRSWTVAGWESS